MRRGYQLEEIVDAGLAPSVRWLQKEIRAGRIPAMKAGRHWVMTDEHIEQMVHAFSNQSSNVREIRPAGGLSAASMRRRAS